MELLLIAVRWNTMFIGFTMKTRRKKAREICYAALKRLSSQARSGVIGGTRLASASTAAP
jgi:hypothetical protein